MQKRASGCSFAAQKSAEVPRPTKRQSTSAPLARNALLVESHAGRDAEFCRDSFGCRLARTSNGLASANPNLHRTGDDAANTFVVDGGQVAVVKRECDGLRSRCGEVDALESSERADRRAIDAGMREKKLNDFVPGNGA